MIQERNPRRPGRSLVHALMISRPAIPASSARGWVLAISLGASVGRLGLHLMGRHALGRCRDSPGLTIRLRNQLMRNWIRLSSSSPRFRRTGFNCIDYPSILGRRARLTCESLRHDRPVDVGPSPVISDDCIGQSADESWGIDLSRHRGGCDSGFDNCGCASRHPPRLSKPTRCVFRDRDT